MTKIVLCDDDVLILDRLSDMLEKILGNECQIVKYRTGFGAYTYIDEESDGNIDILFIDIELGEENGIDIARQIKEKYEGIKIIFITAYIQYSQDIFETFPTYFLIKPLSEAKLEGALEKVKKETEIENKNTIIYNSNGTILRTFVKKIKFIESKKRIVIIYEINRTVEFYGKLDEVMNKLKGNFVRCHQSYIVNMDYVKYLNSNEIVLYDGTNIPVSQNRYKDTKKQFMKYLGDTL